MDKWIDTLDNFQQNWTSTTMDLVQCLIPILAKDIVETKSCPVCLNDYHVSDHIQYIVQVKTENVHNSGLLYNNKFVKCSNGSWLLYAV